MTKEVVVDTNVAKVANGEAEQAGSSCVTRCIDKLLDIRRHGCVVLDQGGKILEEYDKSLEFSGPNPGDEFFRWLWLNQSICSRKVSITEHPERGFENFPDDPELDGFDHDDRKFVAAALASGTSPEILNASDTDWWYYLEPLQQHGININFLCPELMPER